MKSSINHNEDSKILLNAGNHSSESKPQIVKIRDAQSPISVDPTKLAVKIQSSANALIPDPLAPRRLSQLFVPLKQDELETEGSKSDDTSNLLKKRRKGTPPPLDVDHSNKNAIKKVDSATKLNKKKECDTESNSSSKINYSSESNSDDEEDIVPSLNDTICSNRSSYFKYYYLGSKGGESRTSTRASSLTSLASLIKEKKSILLSKADKKGARDNVGLMFLVVVLFLVLIIGISLIYHFYYKHLLQLSLFKRLQYNGEERLLELFDSNGNLAIIAEMGTTLPQFSKPEECTEYLKYIYSQRNTLITQKPNIEALTEAPFNDTYNTSVHEFQFDNETVCLDWMNRARVQIHNAPTYASVSCYNVFWLSHTIGADLQDCFRISSSEAGVWWGLGELFDGGYPLENVKELSSTLFLTSDGIKYPWGKILRRVFVSSNGGIITIPDHIPARVKLIDKKLCISVNASDFFNSLRSHTLNYTICSSHNMSSTVGYLNFLTQDPNLRIFITDEYESNLEEIIRRIENPTWIPYMDNLTSLSQDSVLKYAKSIRHKNKDVFANLLLPLSWQEKLGHFSFDKTKFPDPNKFIKGLAEMGFNLALTLSPAVATDTNAFEEGVIEEYWVKQKDSSLPMLMKVDSASAATLTDFTNPRASNWYITQIENIQIKYGINHFHLSAPNSDEISVYHEFHSKVLNPDIYLKNFLKSVSTIVFPLGTDAAIVPPPLPTFVTVGNLQSDWNSLQSLIPRILTISMLGYPLIDAGPIGGIPHLLPEAELYIRWTQVAAFLPVFKISVSPNAYSSDVKTIVKKFIKLRKDIIIPRIISAINDTLVDKYPLISPLGIIYPHDLHAAAISDQWIISKDLLVAPVLHKGMTVRDIYIPEGLWESQPDGRLKNGPGWLRNYEVPLHEIAYFIKRYSIVLSG